MASKYTFTEIEKLHEIYNENPCLETVTKLAILLNKPRRSIISKLARDGLYITKGYLTKRGKPARTKLQLVRNIEDALDIKLTGLSVTPKVTLELLEKTIVEHSNFLEDTLEELGHTLDVQRVKDEIANPLAILQQGK